MCRWARSIRGGRWRRSKEEDFTAEEAEWPQRTRRGERAGKDLTQRTRRKSTESTEKKTQEHSQESSRELREMEKSWLCHSSNSKPGPTLWQKAKAQRVGHPRPMDEL